TSRVHAKALEHRLQRLTRERGVLQRVAGTVEAGNEAVTDEDVVTHPLDIGEIFDARKRVRLQRAQRERERESETAELGEIRDGHMGSGFFRGFALARTMPPCLAKKSLNFKMLGRG